MLSASHYYRQHHWRTVWIPKSSALNASLTASFCRWNYWRTAKNIEGNTKRWCEIQKLPTNFQNFTDGILSTWHLSGSHDTHSPVLATEISQFMARWQRTLAAPFHLLHMRNGW
jgi:hypothetical protein